MKLGPLNHVGIAVPCVKTASAQYRDMFGVKTITEPKSLPEQGVTFVFVNLPSGQVELIEPYGKNSPITKFLERNPKGAQHHICFEVKNIEKAVTKMEKTGATVLNKPRIGAHGTPVVFLHPKNFSGTLIELMESPKKGRKNKENV